MAAPALRLNLPSSQRRAFSQLAQLSDDEYADLHLRLKRAQATSSPVHLVRSLFADGPLLESGPLILTALLGIRNAIDSGVGALEEVAASVASEAMSLKLVTSEQVDGLRQRLGELLVVPAVSLSSKAVFLLGEHQHAFALARIVTDLRPLFTGDDSALELAGSVVTHCVRIQDRNGDDYVSMLGSDDLKDLKKLIDRAIAKEAKLLEVVKSTPLQTILSSESNNE
jgi:hypothetical protein